MGRPILGRLCRARPLPPPLPHAPRRAARHPCRCAQGPIPSPSLAPPPFPPFPPRSLLSPWDKQFYPGLVEKGSQLALVDVGEDGSLTLNKWGGVGRSRGGVGGWGRPGRSSHLQWGTGQPSLPRAVPCTAGRSCLADTTAALTPSPPQKGLPGGLWGGTGGSRPGPRSPVPRRRLLQRYLGLTRPAWRRLGRIGANRAATRPAARARARAKHCSIARTGPRRFADFTHVVAAAACRRHIPGACTA